MLRKRVKMSQKLLHNSYMQITGIHTNQIPPNRYMEWDIVVMNGFYDIDPLKKNVII